MGKGDEISMGLLYSTVDVDNYEDSESTPFINAEMQHAAVREYATVLTPRRVSSIVLHHDRHRQEQQERCDNRSMHI
jgi:hypothetical protein